MVWKKYELCKVGLEKNFFKKDNILKEKYQNEPQKGDVLPYLFMGS